MKPVVLVTGILDTKGAELRFIAEQIRAQGCDTLVMELSLGKQAEGDWIDIPVSEVLAEAGKRPEDIFALTRNEAADIMTEAAKRMCCRLREEGRIHGMISHAGSMGSAIVSAVMREMPFGFPKLLLSTSLHDYESFVQFRDMMMMYPVSESGFNHLTRKIMSMAAGSVAGAAKAFFGYREEKAGGKLIPVTMQGVTTPCGQRAYRLISELTDVDSMIIHCTGAGGRSLEAMTQEGWFAGVMDLTTTEVGNHLLGGSADAGSERLSSAARAGIPQVVGTGSLDFAVFGGGFGKVPQKYPDEAEEGLEGRIIYRHNANITVVSTTMEEVKTIALEMAGKLAAATAPTAVLIPLLGNSGYEMETPDIKKGWAGPGSAPCWIADEERPHHAKRAELFLKAFTEALPDNPLLDIYACEMHINDPEYADTAAALMRAMLEGTWKPRMMQGDRVTSVRI